MPYCSWSRLKTWHFVRESEPKLMPSAVVKLYEMLPSLFTAFNMGLRRDLAMSNRLLVAHL
jgi:hypothetical protein